MEQRRDRGFVSFFGYADLCLIRTISNERCTGFVDWRGIALLLMCVCVCVCADAAISSLTCRAAGRLLATSLLAFPRLALMINHPPDHAEIVSNV